MEQDENAVVSLDICRQTGVVRARFYVTGQIYLRTNMFKNQFSRCNIKLPLCILGQPCTRKKEIAVNYTPKFRNIKNDISHD